VELAPDNVLAINNLAVALQAEGQLDEAITRFEDACAKAPEFLQARLNLARAYKDKGRTDEAIATIARAYELAPEEGNVLINYGAILRDANRPGEAIPFLEAALALAPQSPNANGNLAMAYAVWGRVEDALACYRRALEAQPDEPSLLFSYGLSLVAAGELDTGWTLFDHGFSAEQRHPRDFGSVPVWHGERLEGKSIAVWREQGLGDELLYASVIHDVCAEAERVHIDCERRLGELFARSFPTALIRTVAQNTGAKGTTQPPPPDGLDFHIASGSLMRYRRTDLAQFPPNGAFLVPDPDRVLFWKARLRRLGTGLKVGVSWRSRSVAGLRGRWYTGLEQWGAILRQPGAVFVNLQYDDCSAELDDARQRFGVEIHTWDDIDLMRDLDNVAALEAALDLVIAPANAVAIMAGCLGVPAWQFDVPDDYSMLGLAGYRWLPSIRRFTRHHDETYDDQLNAIAGCLSFVISRR
jgi:Tfp pilus assembly protein PilF